MSKVTKDFEGFLAEYSNLDDGAKGKAFEKAIKTVVQPYSKNAGKVSDNSKKFDMLIRRKELKGKYEIKTSCGELGTALEIKKILPRADFIIYCPEVIIGEPVEEQGFVFTRAEFIDMMMNYTGRGSLVRMKSSSKGEPRISFQSFKSESRPKASRPIADYIWNACYNQPTVKEWFGLED